jgi:tRNA(adenine34) deaminase
MVLLNMNTIFDHNPDEFYMQAALREAQKAAEKNEVPVGAVIVFKDKIIARAHNQVEMLKDSTAHAEMIAITQAANFLNSKWLSDCSVYVTIEPCSMCAGALVLSRIKNIIYGANDPKTGACGSVVNIANNQKLNHLIKVKKGVLAEQSGYLLSEFFRKKRNKGRGSKNPTASVNSSNI